MGKCMRKAKVTGDVAVMEVSHASLGVRTRAKTLALQRLQSSVALPPLPSKLDSCYLELRSRRLLKPQQPQNSRKVRQTRGSENPETRNDREFSKTGLNSRGVEAEDSGIEDFGENNLNGQARGRSTGESTPCSLIREIDAISTLDSNMKQTCSSAAAQSTPSGCFSVPSMYELEEFFAREDQSQQHRFIEKYNFDIVNDLPLPGRYEWVRTRP